MSYSVRARMPTFTFARRPEEDCCDFYSIDPTLGRKKWLSQSESDWAIWFRRATRFVFVYLAHSADGIIWFALSTTLTYSSVSQPADMEWIGCEHTKYTYHDWRPNLSPSRRIKESILSSPDLTHIIKMNWSVSYIRPLVRLGCWRWNATSS